MSSILRALKKLEEDSMPQERQTSVQKTEMRKMVNRRAKAPWLISRLRSILLAFLLLSITGWIITNLNWKHSKTTKQSHDSVNASTLKKESLKESILPAITGEQSEPSKEPPFSKRGWHPQPKSAQHQQPWREDERPEFILNGVLWSAIPGKRVALINDRYLKEGENIKGVSIIQIGKKAVILQSGEEKWTIRLKSKSTQ